MVKCKGGSQANLGVTKAGDHLRYPWEKVLSIMHGINLNFLNINI